LYPATTAMLIFMMGLAAGARPWPLRTVARKVYTPGVRKGEELPSVMPPPAPLSAKGAALRGPSTRAKVSPLPAALALLATAVRDPTAHPRGAEEGMVGRVSRAEAAPPTTPAAAAASPAAPVQMGRGYCMSMPPRLSAQHTGPRAVQSVRENVAVTSLLMLLLLLLLPAPGEEEEVVVTAALRQVPGVPPEVLFWLPGSMALAFAPRGTMPHFAMRALSTSVRAGVGSPCPPHSPENSANSPTSTLPPPPPAMPPRPQFPMQNCPTAFTAKAPARSLDRAPPSSQAAAPTRGLLGPAPLVPLRARLYRCHPPSMAPHSLLPPVASSRRNPPPKKATPCVPA
jgi:hypothetical protein